MTEDTAAPDSARASRHARAVIARLTPAKGLRFDCSMCKYRAVPRQAAAVGWIQNDAAEADDSRPWHYFWTDLSVSHARVKALCPMQRLNHFPDMTSLCNKSTGAGVLKRVGKYFPLEYRFFPRSWQLPKERTELHKLEKLPVLIVKPNKGCQGVDISICRTVSEIDETTRQMGQSCVAQEYIDEPVTAEPICTRHARRTATHNPPSVACCCWPLSALVLLFALARSCCWTGTSLTFDCTCS